MGPGMAKYRSLSPQERMSNKAEQILDAAEQLARTHGYNAFSFRDLAEAVGIKSASVHYHFPTKADLGAAVARRYTDRFLSMLEEANTKEASKNSLLDVYANAFRQSLIEDGRMCLCGMFAAELDTLPRQVAEEVKRFFELNIVWLKNALLRTPEPPDDEILRTRALFILSLLEGGMLVARTSENPAMFDSIISQLRQSEVYDTPPA